MSARLNPFTNVCSRQETRELEFFSSPLSSMRSSHYQIVFWFYLMERSQGSSKEGKPTRKSWGFAWEVRMLKAMRPILSVILGLAAGLLVTLIAGENPIDV